MSDENLLMSKKNARQLLHHNKVSPGQVTCEALRLQSLTLVTVWHSVLAPDDRPDCLTNWNEVEASCAAGGRPENILRPTPRGEYTTYDLATAAQFLRCASYWLDIHSSAVPH